MTWKKKYERIPNVKLLMVGAGGIGCEVLKDLALSGFRHVDVIDLDTIDVSNLNRQFLFRREHVGEPKAKIAVEAVKGFCRHLEINFYHDSIFSDKFNLSYFKGFDVVINALDNKAARTHVNRMCLAAKVPLVDAGSSGYVGQVTVIIRNKTECFECIPKENSQKTFPGCTIRNTPSELIHCIVWAKHLFNQLFGEIDIDDDVSPDLTDTAEKEDGENGDLAEETPSNTENKEMQQSTRQWAESVDYDPVKIFDKLFFNDISYLCSMEHLWKQRKRPNPLTYTEAKNSENLTRSYKTIIEDVNSDWTLAECAVVFSGSIKSLSEKKKALNDDDILVWDKDDEDAMVFVASCANIRARIFKIFTKSLFTIKSMAGNIIPAIATTNAIVSAIAVQEVIKLAHNEMDKVKNHFILEHMNIRGQVIGDEIPSKPNPKCYSCSEKKECMVALNPEFMTIKSLNEKILKNTLNMLAPDVTDVSTSRIIISSDEDDMNDINCKKLKELNITDGAILSCDDFQQDMELKLIIFGNSKLRGDEFEILSAGDENENDDRKRKTDDNEVDVESKRARME